VTRFFSKAKVQRCKTKHRVRYIGEGAKVAKKSPSHSTSRRDALHKASFGKYDLSPLRKFSLKVLLYIALATLGLWFLWESISAIDVF
tara:strand:+ start:441 stop:704 length:264 start_codon:yes stop_codon:yes gene_type:complete